MISEWSSGYFKRISGFSLLILMLLMGFLAALKPSICINSRVVNKINMQTDSGIETLYACHLHKKTEYSVLLERYRVQIESALNSIDYLVNPSFLNKNELIDLQLNLNWLKSGKKIEIQKALVSALLKVEPNHWILDFVLKYKEESDVFVASWIQIYESLGLSDQLRFDDWLFNKLVSSQSWKMLDKSEFISFVNNHNNNFRDKFLSYGFVSVEDVKKNGLDLVIETDNLSDLKIKPVIINKTIAIKTQNKIYLFPSFQILSENEFNKIKINEYVRFIKQDIEIMNLKKYLNNVQKFSVVNASFKSEYLVSLMKHNSSYFLKHSIQAPFVQMHMPSLAYKFRNLENTKNSIFDFISSNKNSDKKTKILGWFGVQQNKSGKYFSVHAAIEAIQMYRL